MLIVQIIITVPNAKRLSNLGLKTLKHKLELIFYLCIRNSDCDRKRLTFPLRKEL